MVSHHIAVVGGEENERVIQHVQSGHLLHQTSQFIVDVCAKPHVSGAHALILLWSETSAPGSYIKPGMGNVMFRCPIADGNFWQFLVDIHIPEELWWVIR